MGICGGGRVRMIVIEDNEDTGRRLVVNNYDLENTFSTTHVDEYTNVDAVEGIIQMFGYLHGSLSADNKTITVGDIEINANEVIDMDDPEADVYENYGLIDGLTWLMNGSQRLGQALVWNGQIAVLTFQKAGEQEPYLIGSGVQTNKLGSNFNLDSVIRDSYDSLAIYGSIPWEQWETVINNFFKNEVIMVICKSTFVVSGYKSLPLKSYDIQL